MNIGTMNIDNLTDSMTEDEAFGLVYNLSRKFGWSIAGIVTKTDIEYYWRARNNENPTAEQVESVMSQYTYRKLNQCLSEDIDNLMYDAITEAMEAQS